VPLAPLKEKNLNLLQEIRKRNQNPGFVAPLVAPLFENPPPCVDEPPPPAKTGLDFNGPYPRRMVIETRLAELIRMSENSKGMSDAQIKAISDEGDQIIEQLPGETVRQVFEIQK
jgi:hypothetical protein